MAEIERIDALISPLLKKGQAPYHIWKNHYEDLGFCLATFYTYINAGLFSSGRMDLVRAVRMRSRNKKDYVIKDKRDFTGRTYLDYLIGMEVCYDDGL